MLNAFAEHGELLSDMMRDAMAPYFLFIFYVKPLSLCLLLVFVKGSLPPPSPPKKKNVQTKFLIFFNVSLRLCILLLGNGQNLAA